MNEYLIKVPKMTAMGMYCVTGFSMERKNKEQAIEDISGMLHGMYESEICEADERFDKDGKKYYEIEIPLEIIDLKTKETDEIILVFKEKDGIPSAGYYKKDLKWF